MEKKYPETEELMEKIRELEAGQTHLNHEMTRLLENPVKQRSNSLSPLRRRHRQASPLRREVKIRDRQYLNILQSMGQAVHIFDQHGLIIYWNQTAEQVFGFSSSEALGQNAIELLTDPLDYPMANNIVDRVTNGESWKGQFPVKNKKGDKFVVVTTNTPFYDDDGTLNGIISVSSDASPSKCNSEAFSGSKYSEGGSSFSRTKTYTSAKLGLDPQQPIQVAIASKLSNLATKVSNKVKSKIMTGDNNAYYSDSYNSDHGSDAGNSSGASTPKGDLPQSPFAPCPNEDSTYGNETEEGKPKMHKILSSKAEAWMGKKGIAWPWKGNEREVAEPKTTRFSWPWLNNDQENEKKKDLVDGLRSEDFGEGFRPTNNEASGSWSSSFNVNSSSSASSCGSTSSEAVYKADVDSDCLDYEILWEDLAIGEQVGQGSCGTVYHALWYGSDVAVKVFSKLEYSSDIILSFRQEVALMKKLRHPNVLLFMGAVTSPQRLCIVTEFLPRGSLFRILQRNTSRLDWKRRVHIALDIARGMNYLHHCNPPIIHRDLKSSNLLVDKNWTVKVGDFGLSRLKRETYLTTKSGKGTPQWMAPEVLRNEQADEKSDIYSYGVILWELVTEKIPWENLNSMQVIGAVGFMDQRLELPKDIDPQWASLIESCWHSEPQHRPTSQELLDRLKNLQKQYTIQFQAARSTLGDGDTA